VSSGSSIYGYNESAAGGLTPIAGSPFAGTVGPITVNGTYLFGVDNNGAAIDSFRIESNGALEQVASLNVARSDPNASGVIDIFLDKTGATLYATSTDGDDNQQLLSYTIEKSTGELTFIGQVDGLPGPPGTTGIEYYPPKFLGTDKFLYAGSQQSIAAWQRQSNGALALGPTGAPLPETPPGYVADMGEIAAADPTNHLAFTFTAHKGSPGGTKYGAEQLVSYTADAHGNLTTESTYKNSPMDSVNGYAHNLVSSPSGKLLAVSGPAGIQVFHFNGGSPITKYTGLLIKGVVYDFRWDNYNHLVAFNYSTGHLHIFTVTPTEVSEVPGSPFTLASGYGPITIQNLPR
jgi:hypothetical protein